ncbi:hypothetical protein [Longimicrobium sp.]|uniref:hypothetical protein n=1 Tax=Longimicrobium sp. TaxID=2029185 RepID=UPI002E36D06F|nr:hypothetical protein [Longimicrobium sp.]HEX6039344.1 hypothetical protein [Longimicrobium sp.]
MNDGVIFLLDGANQLVEMREAPYADEPMLQKLLADHPHLMACEGIGDGAPRRWLLVAREMPVSIDDDAGSTYGYLDHLFLDQDAVPTLVEVKRSSDTRIRREVVGQMMDYAANAERYWPVERMREHFERRFRDEPGAAERALAAFLGDADPEAFWKQAKTNLIAGKVRLVFVADVIPASLRRIIEFLNGQMDPAEVLGVEVRQYVGPGIKTLVPRMVGQTAAAESRKGVRPQGEPWTEPRFRDALRQRAGDETLALADRILAWARVTMPTLWFGRGTTAGSIIPQVHVAGRRVFCFALWTGGTIELQPQHMKYMPGFEPDERRREFLERINAIPGVDVPADAIQRRPSFPLAHLRSDEAMQAFFGVMEWAISVSRAAASASSPVITGDAPNADLAPFVDA